MILLASTHWVLGNKVLLRNLPSIDTSNCVTKNCDFLNKRRVKVSLKACKLVYIHVDVALIRGGRWLHIFCSY